MKLNRISIRWQLTLAMGLALVLALGSSSLFYSRMIAQQADRMLLGTGLPAQANAIRSALETAIAAPTMRAEAIAQDEFIRQWLMDGESEAAQDQLVRVLRERRENSGALTTFVVSAASGDYWTYDGYSRSLSRDNPQDGWFWANLSAAEDPLYNPDIDIDRGTFALFINYKVRDHNNRPIAVAGLGLAMDAAAALVRESRIGEQGRAYLVAADGALQIHENTALVRDGTTLAQYTSPALATDLLRSTELRMRSLDRQGQRMLIGAIPLQSIDWYLVVEIPEAEVYAESRRAVLVATVFGVVLLAAALLVMWLITGKLLQPVRNVSAALLQISSGEGDLTQRLDATRGDEIGELARGFNRFVDTLAVLIRDVRASNEQLHGIITQVVAVVEATQQRAAEQNQMTDSVATAMHQMTTTVGEITRNATDTASFSQEASQAAADADKRVENSLENTETMRREIDSASGSLSALVEDVDNIVKVIEVIRAISEQTNLLALNAAIEAARAGESGRGFAVVADEVRTLATRTRSSTEDIQTRIQQLHEGTQRAVTSMNAGQEATATAVSSAHETRDALKGIHEQLMQVVDMNHQIATATEEQSAVTDDVNKNVQGIADVARESADELSACANACTEMGALAEDLRTRLGRFRTD